MPETKVCGKCGAKNPVSNNFCEQCGSKLGAPGQVPEKPSKPAPTVKVTKTSPEPETKERASVQISAGPSVTTGSLPWMQWAFVALFLIAVFTRFDHLGAKPHHHDESMHSFYSWQLFHDGDYEYNPMMHGPFQFHGNAFMYFLFGVSNATSRYLAAFFGLLTVILAMLLTPYIGRWGAFLATLLIVASPSFMYFDRFTREDAYICGATFMMVVFLFRYYRSRIPMDLWLATVGFTIAFCTKESIFITVAVIGTYLFIRLLPWADVFIAGGITALGIIVAFAIMTSNPGATYVTDVLLAILGCAFIYTAIQLFLRWKENLKKGNRQDSELWSIICGLGIDKIQWDLLALISWFVITFAAFQVLGLDHPTFFSVLLLAAYFFLVFRFCWLWLNNVVPALSGSISIALIIFTLLFTTFFTVGATQGDLLGRLHGLLNALFQGAYGGLIYWKGQHSVHRGDEPWYYYMLELPANEMVSFLFSMIAMIYYGLFKRRAVPLFLAYWYVGSLVLFSWAGEKMPWLILHPLLPALLLTAYFVGQIIESRPVEQFWKGAKAASLLIFGLLTAYSLHSAVGLSFYREANPVEPLVYVQSGPDCQEVESLIRKISYGETGGPNPDSPPGSNPGEQAFHDGLPLTIEDKCSWPFAWQLRDFDKRNHPSSITQADNPIILTGTEADSQSYPILSKAGYVNRKYKLRIWWVPSWFKKGFPGTEMNMNLFFDWLFSNFIPLKTARPDMVDWSDLKKWILYREVWSDLGSYNMRMWVRPDLAAKYGFTDIDRADVQTPGFPPPQPTPAPTSAGKHKHDH